MKKKRKIKEEKKLKKKGLNKNKKLLCGYKSLCSNSVCLQDGPAVSRRKSAAEHHLHSCHAGQQDAAGQSGAAQHQLHRQRLQDGLRPPSLGTAAACACVCIFLLTCWQRSCYHVTNVYDDLMCFL